MSLIRIRMLSTHGGSLGPLLPVEQYEAGREYDLPAMPGCLADVFLREGWAVAVPNAPEVTLPQAEEVTIPYVEAVDVPAPHGLSEKGGEEKPAAPPVRGRHRRR